MTKDMASRKKREEGNLLERKILLSVGKDFRVMLRTTRILDPKEYEKNERGTEMRKRYREPTIPRFFV